MQSWLMSMALQVIVCQRRVKEHKEIEDSSQYDTCMLTYSRIFYIISQ